MLELLLAAALQAAPARACDARGAVAADVREMARNPDAWLGRCVRIEGYVWGRTFFSDVGGFYASRASNKNDRLNDGWLGLYFDGWHEAPWRRLRRATVTGILHDCGRDYERAQAEAGPDTIVMPIGYCHYKGGLNILPALVEPHGDFVFTRRTGPEARERVGDLIDGQQPPAALVALADRFLAALRARDVAALRGLTGLWSEQDPATPAARQAFDSYLLGAGGSPLAALAAGTGSPQRAYFLRRVDREDDPSVARPVWHVCFCESGDCRARWPISSVDSAAEPQRPYVCLIAYNRAGAPRRPRQPPGDRAARNRFRRAGGLSRPANGSTR
jgi:hypothetical protein